MIATTANAALTIVKKTLKATEKAGEKIAEAGKKDIETSLKKSNKLSENLNSIKSKSLLDLRFENDELLKNFENNNSLEHIKDTSIEKKGLKNEERIKIKEETNWSDEIINHIDSYYQYEIYKNAELHEGRINGRYCLLKDIDLNYVDEKTGKTNLELMEKGRSPIDSKTGEKIELHHMGQDFNGPFVELAENSEHGDGNHSILHPNLENSWRNNIEKKYQYQHERISHWKNRAIEGEN